MSETIARHTIFQNSLMTALLDGIYDGELTIGDILGKGNFGLGTFDALDGEMLILDGVCHQLTSDGKARAADLDQRTPFTVVTNFVPRQTLQAPAGMVRSELAKFIDDAEPSPNFFTAVKITGRFKEVSVRTVTKQEKPYPPMSAAVSDDAEHVFTDVDGVIGRGDLPHDVLRPGPLDEALEADDADHVALRVDEAAVAGGEVLGAEVQGASVAALAGHASAAAAALVKKVYGLPGIVKRAGGGKSCDSGSDDGDWSLAHDYLVCCCHQPHRRSAAQHVFMTSVRSLEPAHPRTDIVLWLEAFDAMRHPGRRFRQLLTSGRCRDLFSAIPTRLSLWL